MKKIVLILAAFVLMIATPAFATGNGCGGSWYESCEGQPGPPGPPGQDGEDGADGIDGVDGIDGIDGVNGQDGADGQDGRDGYDGVDGINGIDGINGLNGIDGIDGQDGVVSETWINETRNWQSKYTNYSAAMESVQIFLPKDASSRATLGMSRINGATGVGLGYAYMFDNDRNTALTVGVGTSGGETVGKVSAGFEFGGERRQYSPIPVKAQTTLYNREYEKQLTDLRRQIEMLKEQTDDCSETANRVLEKCARK